MFDRGGPPALIRQQVSQSHVGSRGVDVGLDGALKRGPGLFGIPLEDVLVTEADEALGVAGIRLHCALEELDSAALIPPTISNFTQSDQSQWMAWNQVQNVVERGSGPFVVSFIQGCDPDVVGGGRSPAEVDCGELNFFLETVGPGQARHGVGVEAVLKQGGSERGDGMTGVTAGESQVSLLHQPGWIEGQGVTTFGRRAGEQNKADENGSAKLRVHDSVLA